MASVPAIIGIRSQSPRASRRRGPHCAGYAAQSHRDDTDLTADRLHLAPAPAAARFVIVERGTQWGNGVDGRPCGSRSRAFRAERRAVRRALKSSARARRRPAPPPLRTLRLITTVAVGSRCRSRALPQCGRLPAAGQQSQSLSRRSVWFRSSSLLRGLGRKPFDRRGQAGRGNEGMARKVAAAMPGGFRDSRGRAAGSPWPRIGCGLAGRRRAELLRPCYDCDPANTGEASRITNQADRRRHETAAMTPFCFGRKNIVMSYHHTIIHSAGF
jgi:hypothetical protein